VVDIRPQEVVDVGLEGGRCIRQSEGHNLVFELAVAGSECRLVLNIFFDADKLVGVPGVQPG
jgi:hypothetical protein